MNEKIYSAMLKMYENKLKEYMTEEEYKKFAKEVAKTVFLAEIEERPDDEYKKMLNEIWDAITAPMEDEE